MSTLKTIRTLPEAGAFYVRYADIAARSGLASYSASPEKMAECDAQLVSNLGMASALLTKVEFESLATIQRHASSLAQEANRAIERKEFQRAGRLIGEIGKLAPIVEAYRSQRRNSIRKYRELAHVANRQSSQIRALSSSMRDKITDIIQKIKKEQEDKIRQLQKAQKEAQKQLQGTK